MATFLLKSPIFVFSLMDNNNIRTLEYTLIGLTIYLVIEFTLEEYGKVLNMYVCMYLSLYLYTLSVCALENW